MRPEMSQHAPGLLCLGGLVIPYFDVQRGAVLVDMVSLFPAQNGAEGSVSPFRSDILSLLKGLKPR